MSQAQVHDCQRGFKASETRPMFRLPLKVISASGLALGIGIIGFGYIIGIPLTWGQWRFIALL